ncbi:MAG: hypothetical protein JSS79_10410 [Bacteroidetes bacterium]|nr:hypothetical protein [Bacteroidota bacterium]
MSHCGCTELFAEIYSGGLHTAQIWYATDFARKNIFKHNDKGIIIDTLVFVATQTEPEIEFNQLDKEILKVIKDKIESNNGIAYEMKWTDYKGFTKKD